MWVCLIVGVVASVRKSAVSIENTGQILDGSARRDAPGGVANQVVDPEKPTAPVQAWGDGAEYLSVASTRRQSGSSSSSSSSGANVLPEFDEPDLFSAAPIPVAKPASVVAPLLREQRQSEPRMPTRELEHAESDLFSAAPIPVVAPARELEHAESDLFSAAPIPPVSYDSLEHGYVPAGGELAHEIGGVTAGGHDSLPFDPAEFEQFDQQHQAVHADLDGSADGLEQCLWHLNRGLVDDECCVAPDCGLTSLPNVRKSAARVDHCIDRCSGDVAVQEMLRDIGLKANDVDIAKALEEMEGWGAEQAVQWLMDNSKVREMQGAHVLGAAHMDALARAYGADPHWAYIDALAAERRE